jgi:tRNA A-37 threonylcarbamoyl transferase component Bud32
MFGVAAAVVMYRWFVPDAVFPVSYTAGRTAHLDVGGRRGEAIRRAVAEQLGLEILEMQPFGLEGSGGSTPLRLKVAGDPDTYLFAKLYATNHLRADRWYKIGRTILYGSLEDEVRFTSVRRLVEYEDYMLLRMKAAGVPSAEPYGIVEITPEREYVIVTEFLQDAEEITTAEVDEAVIDDALLMIRRLWDAGLAHRDIKPANVLVRDGKVRLIDVAFGTIRPSPWRQAVDLANMMIILALRTTPELVYERALRYFAPEDIAEAFAATRSVTIPSQSRSHLRASRRERGQDVIDRFRELAPRREPIAIQRWGRRRVALTAGALLAGLLLLSLVLDNLRGAGFM